MKKASHLFVKFVESNPLIYNTVKFDQYSRLAIRLNIFRFSANNSKTNQKYVKSFQLVCRAR